MCAFGDSLHELERVRRDVVEHVDVAPHHRAPRLALRRILRDADAGRRRIVRGSSHRSGAAWPCRASACRAGTGRRPSRRRRSRGDRFRPSSRNAFGRFRRMTIFQRRRASRRRPGRAGRAARGSPAPGDRGDDRRPRVGRRDRLAVLEDETAAQREAPRQAVGRHLPSLGQPRLRPAVPAERDEALVGEEADQDVDGRARRPRRERGSL